ncbi:MAG: imidazoleglycerol-phosphate dehydratase HisB [Candidatus Omnitrophica bacterium]|nr:imidazoleglycerol-phosphate dehydratase HisB [Candidatus Omnitrophota bacterium]MBU1048298.1 imidazoleglycerol-phosphate dehydratase HisB [Candidatus Omnitrophota bacterium]MBU1630675.1 imidazoleglycerol-phosphate dehydratase HisB [Candidatus Omnitrophota bacterium]MBU1889720.1 imidazoleglycerol-phosphate dehydratase HisB [Candidatus Omnitrophota bacterium]
MARIGRIERETKETKIALVLNIDGEGKSEISTGIPFLDHMLTLFSKHGLFDLELKAGGDLDVDIHHTNEDIGLCLGDALSEALNNKEGIKRFGSSFVPMDEALTRVAVDISGRASFYLDSEKIEFPAPLEKDKYDGPNLKHFLQSFAQRGGLNLHISILKGEDFHHISESIFKGLGKALDEATRIDPRTKGIPSTKGTL